jgi:Zn-dependent protease with chaperone function
MRIILSLLGICLSVVVSAAVDFNDYHPIRSVGNIPQELLLSESNWLEIEALELKRKKSGEKLKPAEIEFLSASIYLLKEMLFAGKITYNDPVSRYVDRIKNKVYAKDPETAAKIKVFHIKDPTPNAFSTHHGYFFFTTGLIARLENEAQLAFIFCHETAHYLENHTLESHLFSETVLSGKEYRNKTKSEIVHMLSKFSKEAEFEADSKGFEIFLKSGYDPDAAASSFEVLELYYMPEYEVPLTSDFMKNKYLLLPYQKYLSQLDPIDYYPKEEVVENSTHPETSKRIKRLKLFRDKKKEVKGQPFLLPREEFDDITMICKFEQVRNYLLDLDYINALHQALQLQQKFPESKYLEIAIGKSMYALAKYQASDRLKYILRRYKKSIGTIDEFQNLFQNGSKLELLSLAAGYNYRISKKYKDVALLTLMMRDLVREIVMLDIDLESYQKVWTKNAPIFDSLKLHEKKIRVIDSSLSDPVAGLFNPYSKSSSQLNKYERLRIVDTMSTKPVFKKFRRSVAMDTTVLTNKDYFYMSFGEFTNDDELVSIFNEARSTIDTSKSYHFRDMYEVMTSMGSLFHEDLEDEDITKTNKFVLVDPYFFCADEKEGLKLNKTLTKQKQFIEDNEAIAKMNNIEMTVLDSRNLDSTQRVTFTDMCLINEWASERFYHEDVPIIPLISDETEEIAAKYGTSHFAFTGVMTVKRKRFGKGLVTLSTIFTPPLYPFTLFYLLTKGNTTVYYFMLFDISSGMPMYYNQSEYQSSADRSYLRSQIYYSISSIRKRS